jgi:DNA polymerase-2
MTYGRTIYQSGAHYLFGRWHLDLKNSFYFKECGWEGLYEIARIAKIPVQRATRTTIGTSLSSMQLDVALRRGLWVPMDKAQAEDFRPASDLVVADKGGLVYEPDIGWFENVAEYDFVSMYPTLMVKHNISPETVNCECCDRGVGADEMVEGRQAGNRDKNSVPEIGHHLCSRRQGIVPEVLVPILKKRAEYKRRVKAGDPQAAAFKARADAHKWSLVTSFGYLGFKNARFGKIEAHESVTAWGRETLLRAKDFVEERGFHVLHANVDCVWIQGRSGMEYEALRREIETAGGCSVGLEGVYKWLRFCPSKTDPLSGVPNRYFGAFANGELKVRGLALRRRDTPEIFKRMQKDMLAVLAEAEDVAGCRARAGRLADIADGVRERIATGRVDASELAVTFTLSKDPSDYVANGPSAVAAKRLAASGVQLHAGETVRYVIRSAGDKIAEMRATPLAFVSEAPEVDTRKYLELLERCRSEIMDKLMLKQIDPIKKAQFFGVLFNQIPRYSEISSGTLTILPLDLRFKATNIHGYRTSGSKSRAYARIWAMPKIFQRALKLEPHYVIEVLSRYYDNLSEDEKAKVIIHELLHIPNNFSGALVPHQTRTRNLGRLADKLFTEYLNKK